MPLQDEINEKANEIYTESYSMSIGELINLYQDGELDIHPEFQRFFRWSILQKSKFIESILLGIPIPPIFVSQREDAVWDIIDGTQRLSTIFQFVGLLKDDEGEPVQPQRLVKTPYLPSLENKCWSLENEENSFTQAQRIVFKRQKIGIQIIKKESDPNIKYELFNRINTLGTQLSDQEVRNCILIMENRDFYVWFNNLTKYEPFLNCLNLSDKEKTEQYHMELALRFFILKNINLEQIQYVAYLQEFIKDKMIEIAQNPNFNKEHEERIFKNTFDLINASLGEDAFNRFDSRKNDFIGKFSIAAFEAITVGIADNIDSWNSHNYTNNELSDIVSDKVRILWRDPEFIPLTMGGGNFNARIRGVLPVGKSIFHP
jgi:hypothetical protein